MALYIVCFCWTMLCAVTSGLDEPGLMDGIQLLYNNDGENLWAVESPYHHRATAITKETIQGSVDDVAFIADVDTICPFHNVPWWNSTIEPPSVHRDWYDKTFGFEWGRGGSQLDYVLKGGDFIGDFADEAVKKGQKPFLAIRLNDGQMCSHKPTADNDTSGSNNDHQFDRLSQFWWDHKTNESMIFGLQETPSQGFKPCCWNVTHPCPCSNSACEFTWTNAIVRDRITSLIAEVGRMYQHRGVGGIELDFQRGLDYFVGSVSATQRKDIMYTFIRGIREQLDPTVALGVRFTPSWSVLNRQGLGDLANLTASTSQGGAGLTYINWGIYFIAYQPFDSDLASLVAALPRRFPFYYEVSSWTGDGPNVKGCSRPPTIRITKEELWTTALLANAYGAAGLSAFNFIYTRPYYDVECAFTINQPFSEPLFAELNETKNIEWLKCCADQFYRLAVTHDPVQGQLGAHGRTLEVGTSTTLRLRAVAPTSGWKRDGRLRFLLNTTLTPRTVLSVKLNGEVLAMSTNTTTFYDEGIQAKAASFNPDLFFAFEVHPSYVVDGNNTVEVTLTSAVSTHTSNNNTNNNINNNINNINNNNNNNNHTSNNNTNHNNNNNNNNQNNNDNNNHHNDANNDKDLRRENSKLKTNHTKSGSESKTETETETDTETDLAGINNRAQTGGVSLMRLELALPVGSTNMK